MKTRILVAVLASAALLFSFSFNTASPSTGKKQAQNKAGSESPKGLVVEDIQR